MLVAWLSPGYTRYLWPGLTLGIPALHPGLHELCTVSAFVAEVLTVPDCPAQQPS